MASDADCKTPTQTQFLNVILHHVGDDSEFSRPNVGKYAAVISVYIDSSGGWRPEQLLLRREPSKGDDKLPWYLSTCFCYFHFCLTFDLRQQFQRLFLDG